MVVVVVVADVADVAAVVAAFAWQYFMHFFRPMSFALSERDRRFFPYLFLSAFLR